ncbi:MAG TPA: class I SAM-dependent methyltransferase [Caulobacteraceae bacterium]|jgi:SAM-dependent methyltransferase|nr:class I SAM-dependent methyltransferase [Caulobacteraceae bacterium]
MTAPPLHDVGGLYQRNAKAWAAARLAGAFVEAPWVERFAALAGAGEVLDLGCGPGAPIGAWLAQRGFALTGVDAAPAMVEQFRARLPSQQAVLADMRGLDLHRTFAGVLAWDSFFHLRHDDQRAMFAVFAAHAAPGAALMFTSGPAHGEAIGQLEGEPLFHASLAPGEYETLLAAHGFRLVERTFEDPACGGRTVWLAQRNGRGFGDPAR